MTLLALNDVSLYYVKAEKPALHQINYEIKQGDVVILLGSNGSGKSSLLKLLYRHHHPNKGVILLQGKPLSQLSNKLFGKKIAVLTQHCGDSLFNSMSVYENYLLTKQTSLFTRLSSHRIEREWLAQYLNDFNPHFADKLDTPVSLLSGGQMQILALALCLLHPPSLLLLDEHTSALDPKTSNTIMELTQRKIQQHHITCLLTTHDLDIALRYGNRVLMLREGKIHQMFDGEEKIKLSKEILMKNYC